MSGVPSCPLYLSWLPGRHVLGSESSELLPFPPKEFRVHVSQKRGSKSWKHRKKLLWNMCCVCAKPLFHNHEQELLYFDILFLFLSAIRVHVYFPSFFVALCLETYAGRAV